MGHNPLLTPVHSGERDTPSPRGRYMSSRLQLDVRNLSLGETPSVKAYEVKAGIDGIAGNTVWSMPECLEYEVLQKVRYINTPT